MSGTLHGAGNVGGLLAAVETQGVHNSDIIWISGDTESPDMGLGVVLFVTWQKVTMRLKSLHVKHLTHATSTRP